MLTCIDHCRRNPWPAGLQPSCLLVAVASCTVLLVKQGQAPATVLLMSLFTCFIALGHDLLYNFGAGDHDVPFDFGIWLVQGVIDS